MWCTRVAGRELQSPENDSDVAASVQPPPPSCDLEVEVDNREFKIECDDDNDESEYECTCEGEQPPASQEPSCAQRCGNDSFCLEDCDEPARDDCDGPCFVDDFETPDFCLGSDEEQERAAIDACDLD